MKVKIIKATVPCAWYRPLVGHILEVESEYYSSYYVKEGVFSLGHPHGSALIKQSDCEIINEHTKSNNNMETIIKTIEESINSEKRMIDAWGKEVEKYQKYQDQSIETVVKLQNELEQLKAQIATDIHP